MGKGAWALPGRWAALLSLSVILLAAFAPRVAADETESDEWLEKSLSIYLARPGGWGGKYGGAYGGYGTGFGSYGGYGSYGGEAWGAYGGYGAAYGDYEAHRHLIELGVLGAYGGYGSGSYGGVGFGGYGGYGSYGDSFGAYGGYGSYGTAFGSYGGYGSYGSSFGSYGGYGSYGSTRRSTIAVAGSARRAVISSEEALFKLPKGPLPTGQCYCRFDIAMNEWALHEPACKASLYYRAAELAAADLPAGLAVKADMLDDHYAAAPSTPAAFHKEVVRFLQRDCIPAPPCSCLRKAVAKPGGAAACYAEVLLYGAGFQRVVPYDVLLSAFSGEAKRAGEATKWLEDDFPEASCDGHTGSLYTVVALPGIKVPKEVEKLPATATQVTAATMPVVASQAVDSVSAVVPEVQQILGQPMAMLMLAAVFLAGAVAALLVAAAVRRVSNTDGLDVPLVSRV